MPMRNLIVILGDQLSHHISALRDIDPKQDAVMMCEVMQEATYVKHHQKKIAFIFSAMRHFADELERRGIAVYYAEFDDCNNTGNFTDEVLRHVRELSPRELVITEPGEWRVLQMIAGWHQLLQLPVNILADDRFYCGHSEFAAWAKGRKELRMEFFYRQMRCQHDILMSRGKPVGGKWNYDKDNRKPPTARMTLPQRMQFKPDSITSAVLALVSSRFSHHIGDAQDFNFAVTAAQAERELQDFVTNRLPCFGDYQDAMLQNEPWLYHSLISFYLNCGLLLPRQVIAAVLAAYKQGQANINAVEGFVRQILGWREFIRGVYWLKMPDYADVNFLHAELPLPSYFWTAKTPMNCLRQSLSDTINNAYAHHIQRLMVIGNFCILMGFDPKQVQDWYLEVYADAFEWVELPNVVGMILYADGGVFASKPYIASGNYINKMSNYCQHCQFNPKAKEGESACPFNYLYWNFLHRHRDKFKHNQRLQFAYKNLDRQSPGLQASLLQQSKQFIEKNDAPS